MEMEDKTNIRLEDGLVRRETRNGCYMESHEKYRGNMGNGNGVDLKLWRWKIRRTLG